MLTPAATTLTNCLYPITPATERKPCRRWTLAISSELGMRPLMERVLSRRDILKA